MSEQTEPTAPTPEQPTTPYGDEDISEPPGDEDIDLDKLEQQIKEQHLYDKWGEYVGGKQQDTDQMLNSVFKKQAQIAMNLNQIREDALANLKENEDKQSKRKKFKDDTEEYIKSIGMKVVQDTNPDFADTIDEARAIDKNYKPKRIAELEKAKTRIIKKMREYESKPSRSGWNTMILSISDDLKKFDYIYNTDELKKSTPNEIDKLTQHPFPYSFRAAGELDKIDVDELEKYLTYRVSVAKRLSDKVKAHRTDLQQQMDEYKNKTSFTTEQKVALDNYDEFYATAKPTLQAYKELIKNYSEYLTPEVTTELEKNVKQIKDYISDARAAGVSAGKMVEYTKLVNTVRKNVRDNYQNILNKMQAYSSSVHDEDAIISEIKSLASYEQYTQLPPDIFEKLPENIKSKVMRLMEMKAKLQKQQGKTKNISQKYKINASNKPVSEDKEHAKVFNPMLNRGYSIFNKVAQHNAYNAGFL